MELKGDEHMAAAAKLASGGMFGFLTGGKHEEASSEYERAGNAYKAAKTCACAGLRGVARRGRGAEPREECWFEVRRGEGDQGVPRGGGRAGAWGGKGLRGAGAGVGGRAGRERARGVRGVQKKAGDELEAAKFYEAAADALRNVDPAGSVRALESDVIPRLIDAGKFGRAAKMLESVAEALEKDEELDTAVDTYGKAADYYAGEKQTSSEQKCRLRVAEIQGRRGQYTAAAKAFEEVAEARLSNELTKFNAKAHLFDAGICLLANGDSVAARAALERYKTMDYTFPDSREAKLLENVINAVQENKDAEFTEHLRQYDRTSKLSPWRTSLLLKIKQGITSAADAPSVDLA
jgi:alpha-soluble NSF attachment protein